MEKVSKYSDTTVTTKKSRLFSFIRGDILLRLIKSIFIYVHARTQIYTYTFIYKILTFKTT